MKFANIVLLCAEMLKLMSQYDGTINDWRYVSLYDEFEEMRNNNVKYRVAVDELARKNGLSATSVERIIRRFKREVG